MIDCNRRKVIAGGPAAAAVRSGMGDLRFKADAFLVGVAAGCPLPGGGILRTRLTFPEPPPPADPFPPLETVQHAAVEVIREAAEGEQGTCSFSMIDRQPGVTQI